MLLKIKGYIKYSKYMISNLIYLIDINYCIDLLGCFVIILIKGMKKKYVYEKK